MKKNKANCLAIWLHLRKIIQFYFLIFQLNKNVKTKAYKDLYLSMMYVYNLILNEIMMVNNLDIRIFNDSIFSVIWLITSKQVTREEDTNFWLKLNQPSKLYNCLPFLHKTYQFLNLPFKSFPHTIIEKQISIITPNLDHDEYQSHTPLLLPSPANEIHPEKIWYFIFPRSEKPRSRKLFNP